jgi:hypothetical protein
MGALRQHEEKRQDICLLPREAAMHSPRFRALSLSIIFGAGFVTPAQSLAGTPFAIKATNVTMPASGNGISHYTVTGIQLTGSMAVTCAYTGPATNAKMPTCSYGPVVAISVKYGQTVPGQVQFFPYGVGVPMSAHSVPPGRVPGPAVLVLGGLTMLGLGWRRRTRQWPAMVFLAIAALPILAAVSACTGNMTGMTPGIYDFTVTAANNADIDPLGVTTSAAIKVTIH